MLAGKEKKMKPDEIILALRLCADKSENFEECHSGQCDCPFGKTVIDCTERMNRAAADLIELLTDEIPHWIPVSERLPEPEANVLIWQSYREDAPYANITIGHLHQESDLRRKPYWTWIAYGADMVHPKIEAWHRADFICPGDEFVTHWMPLPQLPKEEK